MQSLSLTTKFYIYTFITIVTSIAKLGLKTKIVVLILIGPKMIFGTVPGRNKKNAIKIKKDI